MSRAVQALLSGMLITFILDFFLFLGIKINYIDKHEIALYYNILFADHQNIFLFVALSIVFGYLVMYASHKLSLTLLGLLFGAVLTTLIEPIGHFAGETLLMQKGVKLQTQKYSYYGDIYYRGRKEITFYDYKLKKNLHFNTNQIIGENNR